MSQARFTPKRLVPALLAAAIAVAAVAAAAPSALGSGAAASAAGPCKTSGLVIWSNNGAGGGTAGSVYYKLRFTNLSGKECTLTGFPGVSAVDLKGKKIGASAQQEPGQQPKAVKVAKGATVNATLRVVDPGNFTPSTCKETMAAGFRVSPPGQSASRIVPVPFATCSKASQPTLSVGVVK